MELDGQNEMLELRAGKLQAELGDCLSLAEEHRRIMAALRELLLAVQQRDADLVGKYMEYSGDAAQLILQETYSDLFPEEPK